MSERWEYRAIPVGPWAAGFETTKLVELNQRVETALNALGAEGWELVGFPSAYSAVFKRRATGEQCAGGEHVFAGFTSAGAPTCKCGALQPAEVRS